MNEKEEWRPVKDYEGRYEISNLGRVRSLDHKVFCEKTQTWKSRIQRGRVLKPASNGSKQGYLIVNLRRFNRSKMRYVHRLVADAFLDNPNNYPVINHKDENPKNNRVDNLEWCTQKYNVNYGSRLDKFRFFMLSDKNPNRGKHRPESFKEKVRKSVLQFDREGHLVKEWDSARTVGDTLGIYPGGITSSCRRRIPSYKNFIWRYKNDKSDARFGEEA